VTVAVDDLARVDCFERCEFGDGRLYEIAELGHREATITASKPTPFLL
jgi:hypothetical protein